MGWPQTVHDDVSMQWLAVPWAQLVLHYWGYMSTVFGSPDSTPFHLPTGAYQPAFN